MHTSRACECLCECVFACVFADARQGSMVSVTHSSQRTYASAHSSNASACVSMCIFSVHSPLE